MTKKAAKRDYLVGRDRPPVHTRFKPGQSGNPRGRPRGTFDFRKALIKVVTLPLNVTENGRERKSCRAEIGLMQLANKAASGDYKSMALLFKYLGSMAVAEPDPAPPADEAEISLGSEEDEQVLDAFVRRSKEGSS